MEQREPTVVGGGASGGIVAGRHGELGRDQRSRLQQKRLGM